MSTTPRRVAEMIPITAHPIVATLLVCLNDLTLICMSSAAAAPKNESGLANWFDSVHLYAGYGLHWTDSDDRDGWPLLGGIEAARNDRHRFGISLFNNSFGQFSQYYYYGYQWRLPFISESAHLKLTGGLIYGYVDQFEDKLALNFNGWAPAIIPSIVWKPGRLGFEVAILGDAGLIFLICYEVGHRR